MQRPEDAIILAILDVKPLIMLGMYFPALRILFEKDAKVWEKP